MCLQFCRHLASRWCGKGVQSFSGISSRWLGQLGNEESGQDLAGEHSSAGITWWAWRLCSPSLAPFPCLQQFSHYHIRGGIWYRNPRAPTILTLLIFQFLVMKWLFPMTSLNIVAGFCLPPLTCTFWHTFVCLPIRGRSCPLIWHKQTACCTSVCATRLAQNRTKGLVCLLTCPLSHMCTARSKVNVFLTMSRFATKTGTRAWGKLFHTMLGLGSGFGNPPTVLLNPLQSILAWPEMLGRWKMLRLNCLMECACLLMMGLAVVVDAAAFFLVLQVW